MPDKNATLLFDFDDTIIVNTAHYNDVKMSVASMVQEQLQGYSIEDIIKLFDSIEKANHNSGKLSGNENFRVSLMQAVHLLCGYDFFGMRMYEYIDSQILRLNTRPVEVISGAEETITTLYKNGYNMYILTLGRQEEQEKKFNSLNFKDCFKGIEYMVAKDEQSYREFLNAHGIDFNRCYMIGNSIKTDIAPLKKLLIRTIWIPHTTNPELHDEEILKQVPSTIVLTSIEGIMSLGKLYE